MGVVEQCWVTMALDDTSAIKALVLAKSLRRVVTTRKVAVIFCSDVSAKMRSALISTFDQCLKMDPSHEMNGIPMELYVKIFCWSIPFIKTSVFLHPDTLVVKNCDDLFDRPGVSAKLDGAGNIDTSVCILEPSLVTYEKMVGWMNAGKNHEDAALRYGKFIQQKLNFSLLPEKYNMTITLGESVAAVSESGVSIVRFCNVHPLDANNRANTSEGILEKALLQYYRQVYNEDVNVENIQQSTAILTTNQRALPSISQAHLDNDQEPIAIVGMSCRLPMANNVDEYWDILINGKDAIRKLPDDRWPSATSEEFRDIQAGFLKCPVDEFDGKFFNISPFELSHMDPQQRFLLEVTWEALEQAGINPQSLSGTNTGVFVGTWTQDYRDLIKDINDEFSDFHRTYMGNSLGGNSGRLSFLLGLTGPNIATESGCSSGIVAVYLACESLRKGRSNLALAAGANLLLHPFEKRHMVNVASPDGRCKTFDEKADGFGRAEGVATLVLKRYSDAIKAGDNILAMIRGYGISQEGLSRSFGTPTKEVQEIAMRTALADAGLTPTDISYVEAHGTGTVVGDPIEMAAITSVYCKDQREEPLLVGSGKTNIGHTESCSGLAGIIKVILAMHNEVIPPHINLSNLNPYIKIDNIPVRIPNTPVKWETAQGQPRIAGVSSFGITGTDAHIIIQEPPKYSTPKLNLDVQDRPYHLVTLSAKSENTLTDVFDNMSKYLEANQEVDLADAAFTLNTGRAHFTHRVGIVASDVADLQKKMEGAVKSSKHVLETLPKVCFLFTGQGSQFAGMSQAFYETNAVFRLHFDKCDQLLHDLFKISIKPIIWGSDSDGLLHRTLYSQTSIFCVEYCIMKMWESWGITPDAVMGHSLGEFAACVCAGILSLEDAIKLVAVRSRLVEQLPSGKMVVIKANVKTVDKLLKEFMENNKSHWLDCAAVNSPEQTVLAGPPIAVDAFAKFCTDKNLKTHILDATNAFHSRDMDEILPEYETVAKTITLGSTASSKCTYISGLKGLVCPAEELDSKYWLQHTRDRVRFADASKAAYENGCRLFLEVGPQPVLCALTMSNITGNEYDEPVTLLPSMRRKESEWVTILGTLSKLYQLGFDIDWKGFDQYYNRNRIGLPTYPFNRKKHWYETKGNKQGIMVNGKSLHPLLGCEIPNATTSNIFQSTIELEKLSYIKDHAIGSRVVFPGAGYLEMCLTAGNISTIGEVEVGEDLMNPISIEKMAIEAPLGLEEKEPCQIQTIVVKTDSAENKVSIYTQQRARSNTDTTVLSASTLRNTGKWIRQATGTFVPLQANNAIKDEYNALDEIKSRCEQEVETTEFYEKLMTVGLEFGESFRSLGKLWKNPNGNEILTEVIYPQSSSSSSSNNGSNKDYICHPVVLDAMIQTIMIGVGKMKESLFVPVVINKMTVFSKIGLAAEPSSTSLYAHCKWEENQTADTRQAVLYNAEGKVIAVMEGVQMIETSSEVILKTLNNQQLALPDIFEEVWRAKTGPLKYRMNLQAMGNNNNDFFTDKNFPTTIGDMYTLNALERDSVERRDKLIYRYILRSFYKLGWKPQISDSFTVDEILQKLGIIKSYSMLINRYLQIFAEEGILTEVETNRAYTVIKLPPPLKEVEQVIEQIVADSKHEAVDFRVVEMVGGKLTSILSGKVSALSVLFPEEKSSDVSAEGYYNNCFMLTKFHITLQDVFRKILSNHAALPEEERGVIRVLEIGAGTGSSTKIILPVFDEFETRFQYTYTDISPAFFNKAEGLFQAYGKKIQYKVLNVESDPLEQSFIPHHYDIVFASNVLHATRDIRESLRNSRVLLKENGFLVLAETLQAIRDYDILFGLLDGYWRFTDREIRPSYPNISAQTWEQLCEVEGFQGMKGHLCFDGRLGIIAGKATSYYSGYKALSSAPQSPKWWLVFSSQERYTSHLKERFEKLGRKVLLVSPSTKYSKVGETHYQIRAEMKEDMQKLFRVIKEGEMGIEGILYLWGLEPELFRVNADDAANHFSDHLGQTYGFLFLAQLLLSDFKGLPRLVVATEGIIRIDDESATDISSATLWGMVKSFRTEHFNMHVKSVDVDPDETDEDAKYHELFTELWNDDPEFQIAYRQRSRNVARLITTKDFASPLTLPQSERFCMVLPATKNIADLKFCPTGGLPIENTHIEVKIHAFGLNFRDVFVVLKPSKEFDRFNAVGLEYSGTVVATGPNVTRWKVGDTVIGCNFTEGALPSHIRMEEDKVFGMPKGLTFPEAATIPAAFATAYYCLVTVAGLSKGETVLIHAASGGVGLFAIQVAKAVGANIIATAGSRRKRTFLRNLGVEHVFHSRNTDYGKQIHEVTRGQGVHVVLNSLTSPGFKEASLGVCCQKARFIEMSKLHVWTPEEVKKLRPDVDYSVVDLTVVDKATWDNIWGAVARYIKAGHLKPIPHIQYDCTHIRDALTYMQKAKHIGKIIIRMPNMVQKEGELIPTNHLFSDQGTYLITGGLGGIGMELAKWMCYNGGAKNLVVTSRKSPDERAIAIINDLNAKGYNVVPMSIDVGDYDQCAKLLRDIEDPKLNLPKLKGIQHCAGALADSTYTNQTVEMYRKTFQGKVFGAWNLHNLTKGKEYQLEHFVMFSSMTSIFGPIGQSNYAGANMFIDSLVHYRHSLGLCGQSINWGQWGEVGLSKDIQIPALRPFYVIQGFSALEMIMRSQKAQVSVLDVDFTVVRKLTGNIGGYLEELKISKDSGGFDVKMGNFWEDFNAVEDETQKMAVIKQYICNILRQILKLDDDETIDENMKFQEMGVDSLMMLELKNSLQSMLGKNITMNISEMQELTTVNKISAHLMDLISRANGTKEENSYNFFTPAQKTLIGEDLILPEHVQAHGVPCKPSDIKTVLLTGSTGKVGPYMVEALAKRSLEKIFCLIRANDDAAAEDRLQKALAEKNLVVDMSKIIAIAGEVTQTNLGLSQDKYDMLANDIDAVVHVAVKGNLMEPYRKGDGIASYDLRSVNVIGVQNVLEFAGKVRTKRVLHASTLLACHKVAENDVLHEDWCPAQDIFEMPNVGYPISKFIAEALAFQASERGIPVHVHRFPGLLGDKNGCFSFPNNHAMLRLLGFAKLGVMPSNPIPMQLLDVDYAAEISCQLFFNDMAPPDVYNITNPHMCVLQDFPQLASEFGFKIDIVEYKEFFEKLQENDEYKAVFPYREVDFEGDRFIDFTTSPVALQTWINNPEEFFVSKKLEGILKKDYRELTQHPLDILRRDMQFAKNANVFEKFGLKQCTT
ncbi:unnamed protein product [Orchesella dallaii]|uniref:Uncharacterized protein n=1 Tax=Orchesella dallaii TaxID=48710 RepID=A0ABP1R308_9HEXA